MTDWAAGIREYKQRLNAVILVHNYQMEEVQLIADHLGDSLGLSRIAAQVDAEVIVFCGVKFMAETAKILSPGKTVLLPRLDAGCPMADMITLDDLEDLKTRYPDATVVTYVNSSAEIKARSDVCCTSANAVEVVRNVEGRRVIFIPDRNLGAWAARQVPEKEVILFEGYCYVHDRIHRHEVEAARKAHPQAEVLVHPEARMEVLELADAVCSTGGMLRHVAASTAREFIVVTEEGLLDRLRRENPDRLFFPAGRPKICSNMKRTSLADVAAAMELRRYEIEVESETARRAEVALRRMLDYSG
ncbi:MAG: quinolinate synthase NadA [Acidobacteriota bacterium]|jgi:quinolinate synthase|nr:quinolinate synthase NadA [Acidobacteriota bacterium]